MGMEVYARREDRVDLLRGTATTAPSISVDQCQLSRLVLQGSAPLRRFHTSLEFTTSPVTGVGGGRGAVGD